jgi:serine/threonine protein kinase
MGGMWEGKGQDSKNLIVSEFCQLGDLKGVLKRMGNNIFWTPSIFTTREGRSAGQNTLTSKAGVTTNKIDWAGQISLGLTYLHGRKPAIMHRDLKCANILVDKGFKMKITDFGESRHTAEGEMTMTGTAYFMAPEVFSGNGRYDEKCDVYR